MSDIKKITLHEIDKLWEAYHRSLYESDPTHESEEWDAQRDKELEIILTLEKELENAEGRNFLHS